MIFFQKPLVCSDSVINREEEIIACVLEKKRCKNVYCVIFSTNDKNLFDIMDINSLLHPMYETMEIHIVGLASGLDEAKLLAKDLVKEVYVKTGDFKVRDYFS